MSLPLPSTFMPLPLAVMIPFMGMQSMVMAKQFGEGFQFGKRRISAMSNEEFNKLTMSQLMNDTNTELKSMIPDMAQALREMRPFQREIFIEMLAALKEAMQLGIDVAKAGLGINPPSPPPGTTVEIPVTPGAFQPPPIPFKQPLQQPTIPKPPSGGKATATARERTERNNMIRSIAAAGSELKRWMKTVPTSPPHGRIISRNIAEWKSRLLKRQQKLVNLLQAWQF